MNHRGDYHLTLPDPATVGGLKWSAACDAVEDADGRTVAVFEELEAILAGVFAAPPVPPFLFVLQFLHHLRPDTPYAGAFAGLRESYRRNRKVVSVHRHLGLLIAELSRIGPADVDPPTWVEVQLALRRLRAEGSGHTAVSVYALFPPWTPDQFAERVGKWLAPYTAHDLDHWLTFGTAPTDAGIVLAEEVDVLPVSVADVLAVARTRPRLVGATVLTPALDGALALPPRRRMPDALPQGGYADVTTRGDPDRLLLSQFALDPDDFVRRFAERELLYFKREEPHAPTPPERVIVLDQGVRTWGAVRLALAAATLSLLRQTPKKSPPPRLFATSVSAEVPVPPATAEELARVLEASDLTRTPADTLLLACADSGSETPRDVVLLTHPRAAAEPEVIAAARARSPKDRLFVLAVAEDGAAHLAEWTARGPVPVRAFRVDLESADAARAATHDRPTVPSGPAVDYRPWTGDIEPVPFPFRPGLIEPPGPFGFDARGEWLVVVTRSGFPHALSPEDDSAEVLPRAVIGGYILKQVTAVLPVTGGVVVCGVVPAAKEKNSADGPGAADDVTSSTIANVHVAVHYDRRACTVRAFDFGQATGVAEWVSLVELHCVLLRSGAHFANIALDLATDARCRPFPPTGRTGEAVGRNRSLYIDVKRLEVTADLLSLPPKRPVLVSVRQSIQPQNPDQTQEWPPHKPLENGKPLLDGATVRAAQLAADVLAFETQKGNKHELRLFRGPDPVALGVIPLDEKAREFALSPHGRMIAWTRRNLQVAMAATANPANVLASVGHAALHGRFEVQCQTDPFRLTVLVGSFRHLFAVDGSFTHSLARGDMARPARVKLDRSVPPGWDATRFTAVGGSDDGRFRVLADRFGQVLLLNRTHDLLAAFLIRREKVAAWTPAGGFWGDPALIGGAPTPNAAAALADAIQPRGEVS